MPINEAEDELDIKLKGMRTSYKENIDFVAILDDEIVNAIKSQEQLEDELTDTLVRSDKYHMQITLFEHHLAKLQGDKLTHSSKAKYAKHDSRKYTNKTTSARRVKGPWNVSCFIENLSFSSRHPPTQMALKKRGVSTLG